MVEAAAWSSPQRAFLYNKIINYHITPELESSQDTEIVTLPVEEADAFTEYATPVTVTCHLNETASQVHTRPNTSPQRPQICRPERPS